MKEAELLACPFCGGKGRVVRETECLHPPQHHVMCEVCFCETPLDETREAAVERWNTRHDTRPVDEAKSALKFFAERHRWDLITIGDHISTSRYMTFLGDSDNKYAPWKVAEEALKDLKKRPKPKKI